jgi:nicotinamidase-related amidase
VAELQLDVARSALLIMDYQTAIVKRFPEGSDALLETAAGAIAAARRSGMRIIYVVVGFRSGFPEVSPRNKAFNAVKASGGIAPDVDPRVAPAADDVIVTKRRVSAFHGTDLEIVLRANDIETLVLCGIATSGVMLSTLCHAADADYRLIVLRDCCLDGDSTVHACLLDKVFPRKAEVISAAEFQHTLSP